MASYDLDDKKGFFSRFGVLSPSKCLNVGDKVELKHYNIFNKIKTTIVYYDETTIRVQAEEDFDVINVLEGDHVVLSTSNEKDQYSISGDIAAIDTFPPFKVDIKVEKIQSMKELRKHKRYFISELGKIKMLGYEDFRKVIVKNVSFGGIRINSRDDMRMDDIVEVKMTINKDVKFSFKGKVVRKILLTEFYEYGLELLEITESNLLMLHRYMNTFEFN